MDPGFPYQILRKQLAHAAGRGILLGTSSWKYAGWLGTVYDEQRYLYRGKVAEKRFEQQCLSEYAELFPTVCVDAAYYQFPLQERLVAMAAQVPDHFQFTFKVTADITIRRFPDLPRYGPRAGKLNPQFLDADLFRECFLGPLQAIRPKTGLLIFEFSTFHPSEFARGRDFLKVLAPFLEQLPPSWDYGIEIRNRPFLHPDYFALLSSHRVAHIYSSWAGMPSLTEQWETPGSLTRADCIGARLLLKPGRKYQEAVDTFQPYTEIREELPEVRATMAQIIRSRLPAQTRQRTYLYVNNRLEGNAPRTIAAVMAMVDQDLSHGEEPCHPTPPPDASDPPDSSRPNVSVQAPPESLRQSTLDLGRCGNVQT